MRRREHYMRDAYEALKEATAEKISQEKQMTEMKKREKEDFYDALNKYRKQRELSRHDISNFSEANYNMYLQTALEAVYVSALQKVGPLSDDGIQLAASLVENYIQENGGAKKIIFDRSGKTYLLDYIFEAVSIAHQKDLDAFLEAKDDEKKDEEEEKEKKKAEKESPEEDKSEDDDDNEDDSDDGDDEEESDDDDKNLVDDMDDDSDDDKDDEDDESEDAIDPDEDDDKDGKKNAADGDDNVSGDDIKLGDADKDGVDDSEDSDAGMGDSENLVDNMDKDDSSEAENSSSDDTSNDESDDSDEKEDNSTEDTSEDPVTDEPDTKESLDKDGNIKDSKEEMFNKLEKDNDVNSAVEVIAKRISDAETEFIKKNAEDKEKIKNIVNQVDDRLKAVNQADNASEEEKEEDSTEAKQEAARLIANAKNDRFRSVFDMMAQDNFQYIMKDDGALKESYMSDGRLDVSKVIESTRVMYGFLEFVNTIQLEKVDENYISKVLKNEI